MEYLATERNEVLTHAVTWMNLEKMLSEKGKLQRHDSIYLQCPEWINLYKQKSDL